MSTRFLRSWECSAFLGKNLHFLLIIWKFYVLSLCSVSPALSLNFVFLSFYLPFLLRTHTLREPSRTSFLSYSQRAFADILPVLALFPQACVMMYRCLHGLAPQYSALEVFLKWYALYKFTFYLLTYFLTYFFKRGKVGALACVSTLCINRSVNCKYLAIT